MTKCEQLQLLARIHQDNSIDAILFAFLHMDILIISMGWVVVVDLLFFALGHY